jgi:putative ABC transport system permease protein
VRSNGDIERIRFLSLVSVIVLLFACVNFVNLATARSAHRTREVGVRKAVGARRWQLAVQFLGESLILVVASFSLALLFAKLSLPLFNDLLQTSLIFTIDDFLAFAPMMILLVAMVALLAGAYPAFYLSSFRPVEVLKGKRQTRSGASKFRKGLVIFQFAVSTVLVIGIGVVYSQIRYMGSQQTGIERELIVGLRIFNLNGALRPIADTVKNEFLQHPGVLRASVMFGTLTGPVLTTARFEDHPEDIQMDAIGADEDVLDVYGLELAAGRNIERSGEYLINQKAAEKLGWDRPLGKALKWVKEDKAPGQVVGVLKDFHFYALREPIRPLFIGFCPFPQTLELRLSPHNLADTIVFLERKFKERVGESYPISFLGDRIDNKYRREERIGKALLIFGALAILIAGLGLFGLAAFTVELRTREVGIRKTLGATVSNVAMLMSREFVLLMIAANAIAWPLAWYAVERWFENYAYRIEFGPSFFVLSALVGLGVVILTVSYQAVKAATSDPVDALRHE